MVIRDQMVPPAATAALTDADLIERSWQESELFADVFDRHAAEILRYVNARLGPDLAEDIMVETFLAAFQRRRTYDTGRRDARPWLYGIAIRLIGKHRRAESRYRRMLLSVPRDRETEDWGERSTDRVLAAQLWPKLAAALDGMSTRDRELLLLIAWAELTYDEAAQATGLTVGAVRSRLYRIRKEVRTAVPAHLLGTGSDQEENGNG
jgi:RNA polymerase sigma factor (sigma-70 family)